MNLGLPAVSPNLLGGALKLERAVPSQSVFAHNMGAASKAVMEAGGCLSERRTTSARRQQSDSRTAVKRPLANNTCAMRDAHQNIAIVPTRDLSVQTLPAITTVSGKLSTDLECQEGQVTTAYGTEGVGIGNMAMDASEVSSRSAGGQVFDGAQGSVDWNAAHGQTVMESVHSITQSGGHSGTACEVNEEMLAKKVPGVLTSVVRGAAPSVGSTPDGVRLHAVALDKRASSDATLERDDNKLVQPKPKEPVIPDTTASPNPGDISGRTASADPDSQDYATSQIIPDASARSRTIEGISDEELPGHRTVSVPVAQLQVAEDGGNAWTADHQVAASNLQDGGQSTLGKPIDYMPKRRDIANASVVPGANGKETANSASSHITGVGPNVPQIADQSRSKTTTNGTGAAEDQPKHDSSTRTQVAQDQADVSVARISVVRENSAIFAPASTPIGGTAAGPSTKTSDSSPSLSNGASPQVAPLINTAKLIHAIGQSEMRVGMSSAEFGSISISTLTARDMTSAVISLDHSELAKVIATHLPEMQARLGGALTAHVRMDADSAGSSQAFGTFGGESKGSSGGSPGESRHAFRTNPNLTDDRISRSSFGAAAAVPIRADGRANSCLDIRV